MWIGLLLGLFVGFLLGKFDAIRRLNSARSALSPRDQQQFDSLLASARETREARQERRFFQNMAP
jgi:uncharacterized protein YdeI (YjbR/CyaY-like superfamily)